ncbi:DUF177 domain-containing protein [Kineosporia sp. R_H_3]|uniref:YceD family protein n=1 Tax=Kineosporia sp. R_H_3 TaxID=1961848 RepID=UPI000B4B5796
MPRSSQSQEHIIRLDPRSPTVLDTREIGRRPGTMRRVQRTIAAPVDLGTDVIGVPEGTDLELDLRLEAVMEGVLVSGTARGRATGECVRCLGDVDQEIEVDLQELYVYPGRSPEGSDDEDELRELQDDLIDLEPALRDAVVLALPFQPVCREDCPGLCSECGARLADDPDHHHESVDPRWAALQGIVPTPGTGSDDVHDDQKES